MRGICAVLVLGAMALASCAGKPKSTSVTQRVVETQHGIASLYKDHRTASGERYSASAMAAAHRTWPMGTLVRCTHVHNGKSVIVRINDRGPYTRGRIIDLTPAAANAIGLTRAHGLCRVRIDRLR